MKLLLLSLMCFVLSIFFSLSGVKYLVSTLTHGICHNERGSESHLTGYFDVEATFSILDLICKNFHFLLFNMLKNVTN